MILGSVLKFRKQNSLTLISRTALYLKPTVYRLQGIHSLSLKECLNIFPELVLPAVQRAFYFYFKKLIYLCIVFESTSSYSL